MFFLVLVATTVCIIIIIKKSEQPADLYTSLRFIISTIVNSDSFEIYHIPSRIIGKSVHTEYNFIRE